MKTLKTLLQEITAGIKAWANASFSSGTHVHGNITNNGKLATASKVVISDSNKNITTSNVSDTELGHLSGVTSAIQTQINSKAYDADVMHTTGNETIAGTKTFASEINGTASKAIADEDGTSIKTGYVNIAGDQTVSSQKTWSASQFYNGMMILQASSDVVEQFRQKLPKDVSTSTDALARFNTLVDSAGHNVVVTTEGHWETYVSKSVSLKYKNDDTKTGTVDFRLSSNGKGILYPQSPFECSLGNSTNRWSVVYADSYYYGTTAWGLDKENVWTGNNRFSKNSSLSDITSYADTSMAFTGNSNTILFNTRGSSNYPSYGTFLFAGYMTGTAPDRYGQLKLLRSTDIKGGTNDGYIPDTSFNLWRVAPHYSLMDFMEVFRVQNDGTNNYIAPITTNATNLGTSTNKWKSFNGINPGALSFPNHAGIIDVTGDVVPPTGETSVNISGGLNSFTAPSDGWLVVRHDAATFVQIYRNSYNSPGTTVSRPTEGTIVTSLPVIKDTLYTITVIAQTGTFQIKFYPCLGNV